MEKKPTSLKWEGIVVDYHTYQYNLAQLGKVKEPEPEPPVRQSKSNTLFALCGLVALACLLTLVYHDVQAKKETAVIESLIEIERCTYEYTINRCHREHKVPISIPFCEEMEKCMYRTPTAFTTVEVAKLCTQVLNEFFGSLRFEALLILVVLVFGFTWLRYKLQR